MPRIASLSPHELRGCTLRVTLTALLRLRLESRQIRADSGRSHEGCHKSEKLRDEGPLSNQRPFLFVRIIFRPHSTFTLRAQTIVTQYETGIPGISKWYEARITNRGPWPVVVTRCNAVDDPGGKEMRVAYPHLSRQDYRFPENAIGFFAAPLPVRGLEGTEYEGVCFPQIQTHYVSAPCHKPGCYVFAPDLTPVPRSGGGFAALAAFRVDRICGRN